MGVSGNACLTILNFGVFNFVGVLQPEYKQGFSPNFQDVFSQEDPDLINFGSLTFWVFNSLNTNMDLQQIFRMCLLPEQLELTAY